ncbi:MAG: hypothetical protein KTV16_01760 [Acidimicrobiia bacterium]|nr:hypothetical protein [Acidimicrobiia bacterium]
MGFGSCHPSLGSWFQGAPGAWADAAGDYVQAGAGVELRILQPLAGIELAVRAGGVVEHLGEGADHVFVVVEHLVVVAAGAPMALHEDGVGRVDHDLPDVGVFEQGTEWSVSGQVAERPF